MGASAPRRRAELCRRAEALTRLWARQWAPAGGGDQGRPARPPTPSCSAEAGKNFKAAAGGGSGLLFWQLQSHSSSGRAAGDGRAAGSLGRVGPRRAALRSAGTRLRGAEVALRGDGVALRAAGAGLRGSLARLRGRRGPDPAGQAGMGEPSPGMRSSGSGGEGGCSRRGTRLLLIGGRASSVSPWRPEGGKS